MTATPPTGPEPSPSRVFAPPTGLYNQPLSPPPFPPPPQPPRRSKLPWVLFGVGGGILLLCCLAAVIGGVLISRGIGSVAGNITAAQNRAQDYFAAIEAHDWSRAYSYLDSRTQSTTSTAALQRTWTARETANGRIAGFSTTDTNVNTNNGKTTATVLGTLRYDTGITETKTVRLVKEGEEWKLSALP
jgi:hypothetical protein